MGDLNSFITNLALNVPGFLLAIVFHEWAHAYVAYKFGDDTAARMGRLSMNPAVHYDPIGTILFPLIGVMMGGVMFGWARPVPVDARHFKNVRKGIFWVSFAGPGANLLLATIFTFFFALLSVYPTAFPMGEVFTGMVHRAILINMILAVFNLIPFPPLDGSKMAATFMDYETARKYEGLQQYSFFFIILLWVTPLISYLMIPANLAYGFMMKIFITLLS